MREISAEEFHQWASNVVTEAVFSQLARRREDIKEYLMNNAGQDNYNDAKNSGYCLALTDMLNIGYGDLE
jgi:hypothetical protein